MGKRILLPLLLCLLFVEGRAVSDTLYLNLDFLARNRQQADLFLWRYLEGDDNRYATREWQHDTAPLQKPMTRLEDDFYAEHPHAEVTWFRVWVKADRELLDKSLAFHFVGYGWMDVYLDGHLLASLPNPSNRGTENTKLDNHPVFFSLTDTLPHLLALRYESHRLADGESQWGFETEISHADDLFEKSLETLKATSLLVLPIGSTFATLFVIHVLMFFFYRKDVSNLYFALFNLGISVFCFTLYIGLVYDVDIDSSFLSTLVITISSVLSCYAISAFCTHLFSKQKLFIRIIGLFSLLIACATLLLYNRPSYNAYIEIGLAGLGILTSIYVVAVFIRAMLKREKGSRILGAGILFSIFFIFSIVLLLISNGGRLVTDNPVVSIILILTGILAIFSIPLSISSFLAWRYAATNKNLQAQLVNVATLSEKNLRQEKEKQAILENQKAALELEVVARTEEIVKEKQKSDDLLLNILPHEIAEELKLKGESKAQHHEEASVLFTDLVNFTHISEKLGVEELLNELNVNFTAFDRIMEKYGLEKIKTIGDAYLAVSGLPVADPAHAQHAVMAAWEILEFVEQRKTQTPYGLDIRIGINSGPLIAGIIGVKKFAYDIWGDTVNVAARMEQNSLPGKINVSANTYALVKNDFTCIHRGKIEVKGKGEMDMYFVERQNSLG